jgi:hypothetical protein
MNSDLQVDLSANVKYGVEEVGTIKFQLESEVSLGVADVFLSFLVMEDRGYAISFKDG